MLLLLLLLLLLLGSRWRNIRHVSRNKSTNRGRDLRNKCSLVLGRRPWVWYLASPHWGLRVTRFMWEVLGRASTRLFYISSQEVSDGYRRLPSRSARMSDGPCGMAAVGGSYSAYLITLRGCLRDSSVIRGALKVFSSTSTRFMAIFPIRHSV